jgi:hypothetical protein
LRRKPESDLEKAAAWLAWRTTPQVERPQLDTWLKNKFGVDGQGINNVLSDNFHNYKRKVPKDRLSALKEN